MDERKKKCFNEVKYDSEKVGRLQLPLTLPELGGYCNISTDLPPTYTAPTTRTLIQSPLCVTRCQSKRGI